MLPHDRILAYSRYEDRGYDTPCLIWKGQKNRNGYGRLRLDGKRRMAHIVAYEIAHGTVREKRVIDHLCRNRDCVRHEHLEAISMKKNTLRGVGPSAENARKSTCKRGHRFSSKRDSRGWRVCNKCKQFVKAQWKAYRILGQYEDGFINNSDLFGGMLRLIPAIDVDTALYMMPDANKGLFVAWLSLLRVDAASLSEGGAKPFPKQALLAVEKWRSVFWKDVCGQTYYDSASGIPRRSRGVMADGANATAVSPACGGSRS